MMIQLSKHSEGMSLLMSSKAPVAKAGPPRHFVARGDDPHRSLFGLLNSPVHLLGI
jgi:hypothetical protein